MATNNNNNNRKIRPPSPSRSKIIIASSISLPTSLNASFSSSCSSSSSSSSPSNTSKRVLISRSHSTTRSSRPTTNPTKSTQILPARNSASKSQELNNGRSREAFAKFLEQREQRGSPRNKTIKPGGNSSPSAWALSPGRVSTAMKTSTSLPNSAPATSTPPESPVSAARIRGGGGAVAGVLKYFKAQKKVTPVKEEDYHRFRILHNRLLQLRFVNARTEATMANLKINVEDQLFWVWLRIYKMRNYVVENLIEVQRLRQEIKLHGVLTLQMPLLNEWTKLDSKNYEALNKLTRKLHALSLRLPLVHGATIDVVSIHEAMVTAIEMMDEIEDIVINFLPRVEIIVYELTELLSMFQQHVLCLEQVEKSLSLIPIFLVKESSIKVHLLQKVEEQRKALQIF